MAHRLAGVVGQKVLLRDIGDVFRLAVFGEQVIEGLVAPRPHVLGDRLPPFLGVAEGRIDVENYATERIDPVANHLADAEFRRAYFLHVHNPRSGARFMRRGRLTVTPLHPAAGVFHRSEHRWPSDSSLPGSIATIAL